MGNTLNVNNSVANKLYGVIKTKSSLSDTKGKIMDEYIINFFKNYEDNETANNIKGTTDNDKHMRELAKKPFLARACCTKNRYIPVALPYVNKDDTNIKTAYPRIDIFNFDPSKIENSGKYATKCKFSRTNQLSISKDEIMGQFVSGSDQNITKTTCTAFYKGRKKDYSDSYGLCNKAINMRKLSKPNNMLYHFYGDVHNNITNYKDPNNNLKDIVSTANNAYPDCNCINSVVLRTPQKPEITENMKFAMSQTRDKFCDEAATEIAGPKWVEKIDKTPISFCINIADNIKAIASEGSKIKIQQSCKSDIKPVPSITDMDKDDNNNKIELLKEKKTDWELDKCKLDVYKLNYPELIKTFKNNNQDYIDYYNKNNKNEKRNCTSIIVKEDTTTPATTTPATTTPATTTPATTPEKEQVEPILTSSTTTKSQSSTTPKPAPTSTTPEPAPVSITTPESATNQIKPAQVATEITTKTYFGLSLPILISIIVTLILLTGGSIFFLTKN